MMRGGRREWGRAGRAGCWPLGWRQELRPGSRAGQGAACRWPERKSCWPPGRRQELWPGSRAGQGTACRCPGTVSCWPPGGRQEVRPGCCAGFGADCRWLGRAGCWPPGGRLVNWVPKICFFFFFQMFYDSFLFLKYFPHI